MQSDGVSPSKKVKVPLPSIMKLVSEDQTDALSSDSSMIDDAPSPQGSPNFMKGLKFSTAHTSSEQMQSRDSSNSRGSANEESKGSVTRHGSSLTRQKAEGFRVRNFRAPVVKNLSKPGLKDTFS